MGNASGASLIEHLLRRERWLILAGLATLCGLAWLYLLAGAGLGMSVRQTTAALLFPHAAAGAPSMAMAHAPPAWTAGLWALMVAMWWTMMVAMMTPSAAPTILLYAKVRRKAPAERAAGLASTWAFVAGYLLVWSGFSVAATSAQLALQHSGILPEAMAGSPSRWLSAGVLGAAGLYQFTPLHGRCLRHCRSPASYLARRWRPGALGAVRLGAGHGAYCAGCCWLLMALLFVGGVMNLLWIAGLSLLILAQKLLPGGRRIAYASGAILLAWAAATLMV